MQIELLPEDEYALWEQVLVSAEQNSTSATADPAPSLPLPAQELSVPNQAVDVSAAGAGAAVPDLEDFGLKVNRLVKYRPRGLYVTDIAESEWCQQQKAFALSVRLPKVSCFIVYSKAKVCV